MYIWIREDFNTIFYVGKGKGDRAKSIKNNKYFRNIYRSCKTHYRIIKDNLSEQEALDYEREVIEHLVYNEGYSIQIKGFKKNKNGKHLVNCTFGGEGISGYKHSPETIQKSVHFGANNGMFGKRGELSPHFGKKFTNEHKEKIRISNPRRKSVYCIELNREFKSYREASKILLEEYGIICSHASISAQCRGKTGYCGYYKENNKNANLHFTTITPTTTERTEVINDNHATV